MSPNDGAEDLGLLDEWYQFFNACEQKRMQMIIRRRQAKKSSRFLEKGYPIHTLEKLVSQVSTMDRQSMLAGKTKKESKGDSAFISGFHHQYKEVETIFKKYWPILLKDKDLQSSLPNKPKFIYRRAPGFRNRIACNVPDPPRKPFTWVWFPLLY